MKNEMNFYIPLHAEFNIIRAYIRNTSRKNRHRYSLVVIRKDLHGNLKDSKPCTFCLEMIKKSGIQTVIYSTSTGDLVKCNVYDIIDTIPCSFFRSNNIDPIKEAIIRSRGI